MLRIYNGRILTEQGLHEGEIWCSNGRIVPRGVNATQSIDARGCIISPGYIDIQINGAFGVDFTTNAENVGEAARRLPSHGVTSFLPTIVSTERSDYRRLISLLQPRAISKGASILGIHLEGPFFNPRFRGAHADKHLQIPHVEGDLHAFYGSLSGVKIITLAPELPHMMEAIADLNARKIVVALGHSAASLDVVEHAIQLGAKIVTHLFNAMPSFHHRQPGLIDAVLLAPRMGYTMICDGAHLDKQAIELAWTLNPEGLILVSDGMEAMGMPPGVYQLGGRKVEILDNKAWINETETLAGSVVPIDGAVRHFHKITNCSLTQAIDLATRRPASLLGLENTKGTLKIGADADIIFLDDGLNVQSTFVSGQQIF